jgi:ABC-type polar amino acid transport system ATPase subunit
MTSAPPPPWFAWARSLSAGYGERTVLESVSFALPAGRITAVVGPGGSGKSTLLRILRGAQGPEGDLWMRGEVQVASPTLCTLTQGPELPLADLAGLLAGRRCDTRGCEEGLPTTTAALPSVAGERLRGRLERIWQPAPPAAALLAPLLEVPLAQLPPWQARLCLLTALFDHAQDFLLDEPEVALPDEARDWLAAKLAQLRRRCSAVVVTHHLSFARRVADFAALLVDGSFIEVGPAERFFHRPAHPRARHYLRMGS